MGELHPTVQCYTQPLSRTTDLSSMKIPYGQSNFKKVISQGFYYVDKTAYIRTLEDEGEYTVLLRPRRFGKSLFLSMLFYYYDIAHTDEFDTLFGHRYFIRRSTLYL